MKYTYTDPEDGAVLDISEGRDSADTFAYVTARARNGSSLVMIVVRPFAREEAAQALAGRDYRVVPANDYELTTDAALEQAHTDLRAILDALGLGDHARPYSAHECVTRDVLPAIERMKAERAKLGREHDALLDQLHDAEAQAAQPDRPEPVDPASVREGDYVRIEGAAWAVEACVAYTQADPNYRLVVCDDDHEWAPDLRKAAVRILHAAEPDPDEAAVEVWRDWLRGKGCADETYRPDVIARELARADVTAPEVGRDV